MIFRAADGLKSVLRDFGIRSMKPSGGTSDGGCASTGCVKWPPGPSLFWPRRQGGLRRPAPVARTASCPLNSADTELLSAALIILIVSTHARWPFPTATMTAPPLPTRGPRNWVLNPKAGLQPQDVGPMAIIFSWANKRSKKTKRATLTKDINPLDVDLKNGTGSPITSPTSAGILRPAT